MPENSSKKREEIIRETKKAIKNYSEVKGDISKVRGNLDFIEVKLDGSIDKLDKATKLFEALPEEQVSNPSHVLDSFVASGSELARSACAHSEHFKDSFQKFRDETDLLLVSQQVSF